MFVGECKTHRHELRDDALGSAKNTAPSLILCSANVHTLSGLRVSILCCLRCVYYSLTIPLYYSCFYIYYYIHRDAANQRASTACVKKDWPRLQEEKDMSERDLIRAWIGFEWLNCLSGSVSRHLWFPILCKLWAKIYWCFSLPWARKMIGCNCLLILPSYVPKWLVYIE